MKRVLQGGLMLIALQGFCFAQMVDFEGKPVNGPVATMILEMTPERVREAIKVGEMKDPETLFPYLIRQTDASEGSTFSADFTTPYFRIMLESAMAHRKGLRVDNSVVSMLKRPEAWIYVTVKRPADTFEIEHLVIAKIGSTDLSDFVQPINMTEPRAVNFESEGTAMMETRAISAVFPLGAMKEGSELRIILTSGEALRAPITAKILAGAR